MLATYPYPERRENPIGLSFILASAALAAVGLAGLSAGIVTRKKREEEQAKPPRPPGNLLIAGFVGVQQGGGPGSGLPPTLEEDDKTMRTNGLFTAFFTREVEQEVIARMQGYRNKHKIQPGDCKVKSGTLLDAMGPVHYRKYFDKGEQAVDEILTDLYPSGAPWDGGQFAHIQNAEEAEEGGPLLGSVGLWRWWLWSRVIRLSDWEVCGFKPVT
jgi:hypothetical protein